MFSLFNLKARMEYDAINYDTIPVKYVKYQFSHCKLKR